MATVAVALHVEMHSTFGRVYGVCYFMLIMLCVACFACVLCVLVARRNRLFSLSTQHERTGLDGRMNDAARSARPGDTVYARRHTQARMQCDAITACTTAQRRCGARYGTVYPVVWRSSSSSRNTQQRGNSECFTVVCVCVCCVPSTKETRTAQKSRSTQ